MTVDAVIYDIGNVLLEWRPERYYDARLGPEGRRALFEAVDLYAMNEDVDLGADFKATIYATAEAHPEHAGAIRAWHDDWARIAGPPITRSLDLLRALRAKGVPVHALTNFGVGSFDVARAEWPFLDEFDRTFVSGQIALMKPDPEIYAAVEVALGLPPERLLFTDDRFENVAAAATRGWQTHLFEGADGWADRLVDEGLLSADEAA